MKIIGISGSLRSGSFNTKLLQCAQLHLQPEVDLQIVTISEIPMYNADIDKDSKPESVQSLLEKIAECDGILISTPEYNYSIPGLLKNVLDWASRPAYKSVLANKPAGILSAAQGLAGGARAQAQLRHVFSATLTIVYPSREYLLPFAGKAFDESGQLSKENQSSLERYLHGFCDWLSTRS